MPARSLRELLGDDPSVRIVPPSSQSEPFEPVSEVDSSAEDAPTLDGGPFAAHDVPDVGKPGFTHFLDGVQRAWNASYIGLVPIRPAFTAAAIVARGADGCMERLDPALKDGALEIFAPQITEIFDRLKAGLEGARIAWSPAEEGDTDVMLSERLRRAISDHRETREVAIAGRWDGIGCLLVDGGIGNISIASPTLNMVGVVKSHGRKYFKSPERVATVLGLKPGQRTSAFLRRESPRQGRAAVSFYLRLHESMAAGPMFGIIRVELPQHVLESERHDEIAAWLMAERAPLSLPDPRFDRLLYPISMVEKHLKALIPSDASIRALLEA